MPPMDTSSPYAAGSSLAANDMGTDPLMDTMTYCSAQHVEGGGKCVIHQNTDPTKLPMALQSSDQEPTTLIDEEKERAAEALRRTGGVRGETYGFGLADYPGDGLGAVLEDVGGNHRVHRHVGAQVQRRHPAEWSAGAATSVPLRCCCGWLVDRGKGERVDDETRRRASTSKEREEPALPVQTNGLRGRRMGPSGLPGPAGPENGSR